MMEANEEGVTTDDGEITSAEDIQEALAELDQTLTDMGVPKEPTSFPVQPHISFVNMLLGEWIEKSRVKASYAHFYAQAVAQVVAAMIEKHGINGDTD